MPFLTLSDIDKNEIFPGCNVRFIHSRNMTFAHWELAPDARIPDHSHPHEQVATCFEGEFEFTVIPPDAPHSGRAMTECRILDVFYPVRDDYRVGD